MEFCRKCIKIFCGWCKWSLDNTISIMEFIMNDNICSFTINDFVTTFSMLFVSLLLELLVKLIHRPTIHPIQVKISDYY